MPFTMSNTTRRKNFKIGVMNGPMYGHAITKITIIIIITIVIMVTLFCSSSVHIPDDVPPDIPPSTGTTETGKVRVVLPESVNVIDVALTSIVNSCVNE